MQGLLNALASYWIVLEKYLFCIGLNAFTKFPSPDVDDLEEFNILLDENFMPQRDDIITAGSSTIEMINDDCFVVSAENDPTLSNANTTGINVLEVDREFSAEYSYTTNVKQKKQNNTHYAYSVSTHSTFI